MIGYIQRGIHGLSGNGRIFRRHLNKPGRIHISLFKRQRVQKWTELMWEINTDYGIQIGPFQLSFGTTYKHFRDSKEPKRITGEM